MPAIPRTPRAAHTPQRATKLRYANIVSTLALFLALAGGATAAGVTLMTGAQVKDGSLTGADIADQSIGYDKLKVSARARLKGESGARGPAGPAGATGAVGPAGAAGATGAGGSAGVAGTGIVLAGHAQTSDQTLPDDADFHTVWSISFTSPVRQLYILTGQMGNVHTYGCADGDYQYTEQILIDGSPMSNFGAFLTFDPGPHSVAYTVRGNCPGSPVQVPTQEVVLIPFTLP